MKAKELVYSDRHACTPFLVSVSFNEDAAIMVSRDNQWHLCDQVVEWLAQNAQRYEILTPAENTMFRRIANGEVQIWFLDHPDSGRTARSQATQFKMMWNGVDPYDHVTRMQS